MDSLELQLRSCARSWYTWGAAGVVSAALFAAIAVTSTTHERIAQPELPLLILAAAPASPSPAETTPEKPRESASASLAEAFKFDPTTLDEKPEIPLGHIDISEFGGSLKFFDANAGMGFDVSGERNASLVTTLGLGHSFQVQKPENPNRFMIFERDQVDEIPVWLYGPQPRIPTEYARDDWMVLVLYAVSTKGKTENIYILDASDPAFAAPVKEAIANWNFRPARKSGKPVRVWVQQPVHYQPSSKSPFEL